MNHSGPQLDQSTKSVLIILAFLFCIGVVFLSAIGLVGFQIYSARQAAAAAAREKALVAAKAQEKARMEQLAAMELARKEEEVKLLELRKVQEAQRQEADAKRRILEAEMESKRKAEAELAQAEQLRKQAEFERVRKQQEEFQYAEQKMAEIQRAYQAWRVDSAELPLLPNAPASQLSWRVHFLPYIGKKDLYNQFHLDEPWDSEHNLKLAAQMPSIYGKQADKTRFRCFVPVDGKSPLKVGDVTDGLSQLALIFSVAEDQAITWTKPDASEGMIHPTLANLASNREGASMFLRADGQVQYLQRADDEVIAAWISPAGGEHLNTSANGNAGAPERMLVAKSEADPKAMVQPNDKEALAAIQTISQAFNLWLLAMKVPAVEREVGASKLSWRVHLLPYLGEQELYRKFRHDEPWFSENNASLIEQMPAIYGIGSSSGRSRVRAFCNESIGAFPLDLRRAESSLQNQLCLFYCAPQHAETWTAPSWLIANPVRLDAALGWPAKTSVVAGLADGNALVLPADLHPTKLAALMITNNKPSFNLETALESPGLPLRIEVPIQPATKINGLFPLAEVPVPAGSLKQPAPLDPAVQKRLASIGVAMHRYFDSFRASPVSNKRPDGAITELSWRVHILPMLGLGSLYEKFALDEPWDSPTNKKLIEFIPEVYQNVPGNPTATSLHVLTGEMSLLGGPRNWMAAVDGLQNTIMLMELPTKHAIPWTQPEKHDVVRGLSYKELCEGAGVSVVMGDGSYARFNDISDEIFFGLATSGGGELLDAQTIARWSAAKRGESLLSESARRQWQHNQMKQIALAILNYESTFRRLPPARGNVAKGMIPPEAYQLSWRVHILPFLGYTSLYNQFRLAEPWDSPHNSQLLKCMPDCYRDATDSPTSTETRIMTFSGPGTMFPEVGDAPKVAQVTDGISGTIAFFRGPPNQAVTWTMPSDFAIDATSLAAATPTLGKLRSALGIDIALLDGSILTVPPDYSLEKIHAMVTPSGGELVNVGDLRN